MYRIPAPRGQLRRPAAAQPKPSYRRRGLVVGALLLGALGALHLVTGHAAADIPAIRSGESGLCLDVQHNAAVAGTPVQAWACNHSPAQAWTVHTATIEHGSNLCLSVQADSQRPGAAVVLEPCSNAPGQIWLRDMNGFENPNSGGCLAVADWLHTQDVVIASCHNLPRPNETWLLTALSGSSTINAPCQAEAGGKRIACYAEQEWSTWQAKPNAHPALLTTYTDGAPYEAWCADFVSYIYKEAGYSFTGGEADGWDESDANKVQYRGFTLHDPATYTPQPGDVAYFNYDGGHVEIVISGGKTPTFIYGNSGTTDPTTGNGQMAANTVTQDGNNGGLVYYLAPQR